VNPARLSFEYGEQIRSWLRSTFPEFGDHPAAVVAVIRLHHLEGKGTLTRGRHGELIQAAVRRWDDQVEEEA
jgi:hypothetical protein